MDDKERERRRKRYKFALVKWTEWTANFREKYEVEHKENIRWKARYYGEPVILCDWEPEKVLKAMLKLLKED